jgi:small multidrug resistance pump
MSWLYLTLAITMEVCGTTSMKLSEGFSKLTPSIMIFVFYGLSFALFTLVLKTIDISVAYAIWAGLGVLLITLVGILWFEESTSVLKIISIGLIIIGVVGLRLSLEG